jgi:hypothetical protein
MIGSAAHAFLVGSVDQCWWVRQPWRAQPIAGRLSEEGAPDEAPSPMSQFQAEPVMGIVGV